MEKQKKYGFYKIKVDYHREKEKHDKYIKNPRFQIERRKGKIEDKKNNNMLPVSHVILMFFTLYMICGEFLWNGLFCSMIKM